MCHIALARQVIPGKVFVWTHKCTLCSFYYIHVIATPLFSTPRLDEYDINTSQYDRLINITIVSRLSKVARTSRDKFSIPFDMYVWFASQDMDSRS